MRRALTFDDVGLTPVHNNVESREFPKLDTWLTKARQVAHPLLAANMASVMGIELGKVIATSGSMPIMHRFAAVKEQAVFMDAMGGIAFISCGITEQSLKDALEVAYMQHAPAMGFCIDIAQGHDARAYKAIAFLKKELPDAEVIAGNICTSQGYIDLVNAGADAVKVGVGPGAACTTRMVTGFGVPQLQALLDIRPHIFKYKVPMIADGGIRTSGDIVKALAAGACTVMLGKAFAQTVESAGQKRTVGGNFHIDLGWQEGKQQEVLYKGQASAEFQREGMTPEGIQEWIPVTGTADALIRELCGGIRSGLTYGDSRTIKEFQRKVMELDLFFETTPAYIVESHPRK